MRHKGKCHQGGFSIRSEKRKKTTPSDGGHRWVSVSTLLLVVFSSRREVDKKLEKRDVTQWLGHSPHPVCHPACFPSIFRCLAFLSLKPQKPPEASHLCLPSPIPESHVIFFILPAEFLVRSRSGRPREAALSRLYVFERFPTMSAKLAAHSCSEWVF